MAGCLEVVPRYNPLGSWQGGVGISQVLYSQFQKDCAWSDCVEHLYGRAALLWTHLLVKFSYVDAL